MKNMYKLHLTKEDGSKIYNKNILAEDEEDAVYRWATIFNINHTGICQSQSGDWNWLGDGIEVELIK